MKKLIFTLSFILAVIGMKAETYTLVTSASELSAGDKIIVTSVNGSTNYALSTTQNSNNRSGVEITITDNAITDPETNVQIIELVASSTDGKYNLKVGYDSYLYASSNSSNQLKSATLQTNGSSDAAISYTDGEAQILFSRSGGSRNDLRFNYNNGTTIFACYATGKQTAISIYKLEVAEPTDPTITAADLDFGTSIGTPTAQTLTVTGKNLEDAITYSWETGDIFSATGTLTAEGGELTIALDKTADGEYNDNLILTSGTTSITVAVSAKIVSLAGSGEGTEASPYDVARALSIIATGLQTSENVYVAGVINAITEVSTSYGNATFTIVDAGESDALTIYRAKNLGNTDFTSADQIKVDDEVVVYGVLTDYVNNDVHTPEMKNGYLTSLTSNGKQATNIEASDVQVEIDATATITASVMCSGVAVEGATFSFESSNNEVATVDANGEVTGVAKGTATITITYEGNEDYEGSTTTVAVTVTAPLQGDGTKENPYTVDDVQALDNSEKGPYWVIGYILGSASSATKLNTTNVDSNIALGETTDATSFIPVALPSGDVRDALGVKTKPENIGAKVKVYGTLESYFSTAGVKNVTAYEIVTSSAIQNISAEEGAVRYFNLQGVEVANPVRGNVYIRVAGENATKVLVK